MMPTLLSPAPETLQWHHNERDCISNHQPHDCLLRRISTKTSKLRVTGLCAGNSPVNSPHKGTVTRKMFPLDDAITNPVPPRQWWQSRHRDNSWFVSLYCCYHKACNFADPDKFGKDINSLWLSDTISRYSSWVNIGSGMKNLLSDCTKPLPKPILAYH